MSDIDKAKAVRVGGYAGPTAYEPQESAFERGFKAGFAAGRASRPSQPYRAPWDSGVWASGGQVGVPDRGIVSTNGEHPGYL